MSSRLSQIPVEVLLDDILPLCSVPDIVSLGSTNHFFALVTSDEMLWKRKLDKDFNFPDADTARTTGWKFIYQHMHNPRVFVWGEESKGRLGLNKIPRTTIPDVPFPVQLNIPHVHVVSLVAGGMSFHALDSLGDVYVWGTLDGLSTGLRSDGFSEASKVAATPLRLQLPASTSSMSCGRMHSMTLDVNSDVWMFLNWGRPFRLVTPLLDCRSLDTTPAQIECGWSFSSVLTKSGIVLAFPLFPFLRNRFDAKMAELDGIPHSKAHVQDGNSIPCYTWDLELDPVLLPPLPPLPDLRLGDKDQETKLVKIAGMENSLVGLTNKGHIVKFDFALPNENVWKYLPLFCRVDKVKTHPTFFGSDAKVEFSSQDMRITHISANFQTFVAYSTGSTSIVLMGHADTTPTTMPTIMPELQYKSIISVVLGDYHYGALASSGALYTWGAYSKGALGLGDPADLDPGSPGGFATEDQRFRATQYHFGAPPDVQTPTEVRFDHGMKKHTKRFCFAAAAAGWHFGALVIDLEHVPHDAQQEFEEGSSTRPTVGTFRGRGHRGGIFRIGFAGRGLPRGGGGF